MDFLDDKTMVIIAALALGLAVLFLGDVTSEQSTIVTNIISGLFGVAVGKAVK